MVGFLSIGLLGIVTSSVGILIVLGAFCVVVLVCLLLLAGVGIGIGLFAIILGVLCTSFGICVGVRIGAICGSRTAVVLIVSSPSIGLGVLGTCGSSLGSLGALLALSITVRDGDAGISTGVGRLGAGVLLDGA